MRPEPELRGSYPRIPDHSDLRGFSYRAPTNYQWSDDHREPNTYGNLAADTFRTGASSNQSLWTSVKSFLGQGPKGYRRPDSRIHEEVCEALMRHPGIDAREIEVHVEGGVVTLAGTVPDRWMKRASEWVIDHISGVVDVQNQLKLSGSQPPQKEQNPGGAIFPG